MPNVIVVGSLNMDLIVRAARRPATGETVLGQDFRILAGGKGLNQAVAAARLGAETHMAGRVGDDDFGRRLLAFLDHEHVDRTRVRVTEGIATGVAIISIVGGDNAIIVASGANMQLTPTDVADLPLQKGDICVGQFEVPPAATEAVFRRARAAGATTIFNAAPAQPLPATLLEATDLLVVNELELAAIAGKTIRDTTNLAAIADAARPLARDGRVVIATLGEHGAVAVDRDDAHAVPGRKVTVVDTTGAGDCFVGALAAMLASGTDRRTALDRANLAASLAVQRPGAAPSMPTLAELQKGLS
jgi:ribokinase